MSATLHLNKAGKKYTGYIWLDQNQWPIPLYSREQVALTDSITFSAGSGPVSLNLTGIFINEKINGIAILEKEGNASKKAAFELKVNTDKNFTPFEYISAEDSARLLPQIKNESTCTYTSATVWPGGNTAFDMAIKTQISKMLKLPLSTAGPGKGLINFVHKSTLEWKKENSKLSPKDLSEMGLSLSVDEETNIMVMYENEYFLSLAKYSFAYTGGAHGNYGTELVTINKQNYKPEQLTDVLNAAGIKLLPAYLDKVARLQYGIKNNLPLDQNYFLVKKILPSKNFYITTSGIGFLYAPYEIKSFADGEVNLLIPFTALKSYLQPGFKY